MKHVKLGFIIPSTGVFASIGAGFRQTLELYLDQQGAKLGGHPVDVVTVEEGTGGSTALAGIRQLIERDRVDLVTGIVTSATSAAGFPLFEQARVPMIGTMGYPYPNVQAEDVSPYLWHAGGSNPPYTSSMGQHMAETVDPARGVYLISSDFVGGRLLLDAVAAAHARHGGRIVGTSYPPLGTTLDYRPYLGDIQRSGAAGVYAVFDGADAVRFVQQFRAFGFDERLNLFATSGLVTVPLLEAMGEAAEGIVTNGFYAPQLRNDDNVRFVADFAARHQTLPDDYEGRMWDAMTFMGLALAKVNELSSEAIVDALASVTTFNSPRGTWQLDPSSHVAIVPMNLWQVGREGGRMVNQFVRCLGTFDPASGRPLT